MQYLNETFLAYYPFKKVKRVNLSFPAAFKPLHNLSAQIALQYNM